MWRIISKEEDSRKWGLDARADRRPAHSAGGKGIRYGLPAGSDEKPGCRHGIPVAAAAVSRSE